MISLCIDSEILNNAQILWDYLKLDLPLRKADCIIAMGSHDLRVGRYAAQLVLDGWAPLLVCTGGLGRLTSDIWKEPEAQLFAREAGNLGLLPEQILLEEKSTNTAENLEFTRNLLEKKGINIQRAILVHKPYMERRVFATMGIVWKGLDFIVTSPPVSLIDYPTADISMEEIIQIMVGDFQRIMVYPERGYQTKQEIPPEVQSAFDLLVKKGFTHHLIINE